MRLAFGRICALALVAACPSVPAAERVGIVTLLEGPASVVRGASRHALAEGVRFQPGDIVEVSEKGLTEIEFADGVALAMGPGTRVLAVAASRGKVVKGDYYVTRGMLKVSHVKRGTTLRFLTPILALQPVEGATVMTVSHTDGAVFVEGGEAQVLEAPAAPASPVRLKTGDFYTRKAEQKSAVAKRPSAAFVDALPRIFLDPLPSRIARYKDREVQPKRAEEVSYADVEEWLKAPPDIRRPLMNRFRPRLRDPGFRSALVENLKFHPEWDPILFPEKYKPKEPAEPGSPAPAGAGGAR